ncbi:MAG: CpaF family protein [Candidatus Altiarchaeales archaeon]|nr:MAG: CpaF family protein [Candidatus Altiarchaeales archaeon]
MYKMEPKVLDAYGDVKIIKTPESPIPLYIVMPVEFTDEEMSLLKDPKRILPDYRDIMKKIEDFKTSFEKEEFLRQYLEVQLEREGITLENSERLITKIMDDLFLGYGRIGPLMRDDDLEEIMINGIELPVFVFHRRHGMCATNIEYNTMKSLNELIDWISRYAGREITREAPLLDAHLPDGSRANAAISPAAPHGPSVTIRKFKRIPYNIIDLITLNTITTDLAAFLWVCLEGFGIHPCDILIAGGSGSGKTTLLNALAMFIPRSERIITVEDTLELNFDFLENWVALEAHPSVLEKKATKLDMPTLLENALRMRPDRVLVGEVRGVEAETLFIAMNIGLNGSMGTIHANNAREATIRLMDEPMNLPIRMFRLLDLIVVTNRFYSKEKGIARRVTQVSEVAGIEKNVVQLGDIYLWDKETDKISRTDYPILLKEKIAERTGISKKQLNSEIYIREKVLEYMVKNNIRDNKKVVDIFQEYHMNPSAVISRFELDKEIKEEFAGVKVMPKS